MIFDVVVETTIFTPELDSNFQLVTPIRSESELDELNTWVPPVTTCSLWLDSFDCAVPAASPGSVSQLSSRRPLLDQ